MDRPTVPLYFKTFFGRSRSRLFLYKDNVYCSMQADVDSIDTPEGFIEMKGSEFFRIIEEADAAQEALAKVAAQTAKEMPKE
jgi:hypothetical protein